MPVKVMIPTPLRAYAEKTDSVEVDGRTAGEVLNNVAEKYSQLKKHLFDERGSLRSYINIYVNDEDIRYLQNEKTEIKETDVISIVPSIAGGSVAVAEEIETKVKEKNVRLSNEEILRYSRHLIMPEVGMEGQKKLKAASVLMIGAGGLGSPLGMYLAAAGVGKLGKVEAYETMLNSENALEIIRNYDLVVDGTDNFPTRYLVNDACVLLSK